MNACLECGQPTRKATSVRCRSCSNRRNATGKVAWNKGNLIVVRCEVCGESVSVQPWRVRRFRTCSTACNGALKSRTTGSAHPLFKPKVRLRCEVCGREREVKPSLVSRFRFCSRNCSGAWVTANSPRISSIERLVAAHLLHEGHQFHSQVPVGPFVADFVIGHTIVEVDGSYWHSLPKVIERDERKAVYYVEHGWTLIRLGEAAVRAGDFSALACLKNPPAT